MRNAAINTVDFLARQYKMTEADALAYASADVNFAVTQVVDIVKGVHARITKAHLVCA